jgi:hypothetical protein
MLTKKDIIEKLISSDALVRELGADEVRDMLEFNSVSEDEVYEYALSLLGALDMKNTKQSETGILFALSHLVSYCDYMLLRDVNWQQLLPILERVNDFRTICILDIFGVSYDLQYLPVIQKYKNHYVENIRSAAINAEKFLLEGIYYLNLNNEVVQPISSDLKTPDLNQDFGENSFADRNDTNKSVDEQDLKD